jgi:glucose/arabinose dehydrogenase
VRRTSVTVVVIAAALVGAILAWRTRAAPARPLVPPKAGTASEVHDTERGRIRVTELVTHLDHPWSVAFLPDAEMLITERPGRLRRVSPHGDVSEPLAGVPEVFAEGQSGLLDVAVSPTFPADRLV